MLATRENLCFGAGFPLGFIPNLVHSGNDSSHNHWKDASDSLHQSHLMRKYAHIPCVLLHSPFGHGRWHNIGVPKTMAV